MHIDEHTEATRDRFLRHAVLHHFETSLGLDTIERLQIDHEGIISSGNVQRIARMYNFANGVPVASDRALATELNAHVSSWPDDLVERAHFCIQRTLNLVADGSLDDRQLSGVSKLMWFLRPLEWTPYDSRVCRALGINGNDSAIRFVNYYQEIADRGFVDVASQINGTLSNHGVQGLFGERIIDKFLMMTGMTTIPQEGIPQLPDRVYGIEDLPRTLDVIGAGHIVQLADTIVQNHRTYAIFNG